MTRTLGQSLILLALLTASAGAIVAFVSASRRLADGWRWTQRLVYLYAAAIALANAVMVYALLVPDFSVSYVAHVGSRTVPTWVAIVSLWSSLEGSILFWGLVLGVYLAAATWTNRASHPEYMTWAAGVWLSCAAFFSFLLAGPAQPFGIPTESVFGDGPGPNALLQNHILMAVHPPFLYAGYVGMTIPFGLAAAALLAGRLGQDFLRTLRTWLLLPWTFLTIAIVLGGWWAYEVLGWGGYWAWDPVENASLLPWLTATAAVHSGLLVERKGVLKGWTVTLIMASFLLTILGTFMTRSGVFNSVHSFTQSAIGPTILAFLATVTLFVLALLTLRIDLLKPDGQLAGGASRDSFFLVNNLVFVLFTFTVLIGTVFPLVVDALRGTQMSVGRPYFDRMAVPLGVAILFLMGVGPALPWVRTSGVPLLRAWAPPLLAGAALTAIGGEAGVRNVWTLVALFFAGYAIHVSARELWRPVWHRLSSKRENIGQAVLGTLRQSRRRVAAYVIHVAVAVILVAVAISSTMAVSREVVLTRGESVDVGRYTLTFLGADARQEPNRASIVARVDVARDGQKVTTLTPRMNDYATQREPVGTPAVRTALFEDLYLSVMNVDPNAQTLGLHVFVNPMVAWIWAGMIVMALGGFAAALPPRRTAQ
jgi:cytochrome c-type biogenesis protein CcmF